MKWTERLTLYEKLTRLDKPIGILLLLWPTLWGMWLASAGQPNWIILWIFVLGVVLMRSAGCAINDYADRDFDSKVARTKNRPLASGVISKKEALIVAAVLSLCAFLLILRLNRLTIYLSLAALFLALTYPYTKRFFAIPQAYLGIAFGFGIPMSFAALTNTAPPIAWVILLANVFWAIAYDTEYAMVDREDDRKIGIKSSALFFGRFDVAAIMLSFASMLVILVFTGLHFKLGAPYYVGLGVAAALMLYQYFLIKNRDAVGCFKAFQFNNWVGMAIFAGIVFNYGVPFSK